MKHPTLFRARGDIARDGVATVKTCRASCTPESNKFGPSAASVRHFGACTAQSAVVKSQSCALVAGLRSNYRSRKDMTEQQPAPNGLNDQLNCSICGLYCKSGVNGGRQEDVTATTLRKPRVRYALSRPDVKLELGPVLTFGRVLSMGSPTMVAMELPRYKRAYCAPRRVPRLQCRTHGEQPVDHGGSSSQYGHQESFEYRERNPRTLANSASRGVVAMPRTVSG
ncbi:hypothetical protein EVG20_g8160 [Dentipellis fragilis]|uniref:Uncharacterized protein n=1 Tax=Dentipellis fragilis TaxID=205917 RepID=A0A4Y9Y9J4_9AGAM|nr:hypothetical protein EVG20_g8160 [Dentipellis fragilis]